MTRSDDEIMRQGRRRLKNLLPAARAAARRGDGGPLQARSGLAHAAWPHFRESNLDALVVYPAELGGWHADLRFKNVPPGIPRAIGTPVSAPLGSREAAEETAFRMLAGVLANMTPAVQRARPVFLLCGFEIPLDPEAFSEVLRALPEAGNGYGSAEVACARIREVLEDELPGGVSGDAWMALTNLQRQRVCAVLHMAALSEVYRYPPSTPLSPSGHAEPPPEQRTKN
jgi:hypothetical protein